MVWLLGLWFGRKVKKKWWENEVSTKSNPHHNNGVDGSAWMISSRSVLDSQMNSDIVEWLALMSLEDHNGHNCRSGNPSKHTPTMVHEPEEWNENCGKKRNGYFVFLLRWFV
jgi:hypothetical protein